MSSEITQQPEADNDEIQKEAEEYEKQCNEWLSNYKLQATTYRLFNSVFQLTIALGAALTAFTVIYPDVPKIVPAILGSLVALSTGLINYYQFDRVSMGYQKIVDAMLDEMNYFHARVESYRDQSPKDALEKFMERMNAIKNGRLANWGMALSK